MLEESLIQDKCGVFGIWGAPNAAEYVYLGLHNENHRGQEFCGIVTETSKNEFHLKHGMGIEITKKDINYLNFIRSLLG